MKVDRYKMHPRFDAVELVIDPDGSVCYTRDVAKLEAKCAELEAKCAELETKGAELLEAATNAVWWWDGGNPISPKASDVMGRLRAAIAKAKGEQP